MKIVLKINNEDKTFVAPFISARRLKDTFALSQKIQNGINENILDEVGTYLVNVYGKQFTLDELYDGLPANAFINKAVKDMQEVIGNFDNVVKN